MALVRWSPYRDLMNIQDEFNRMIDRFFGRDFFGDLESISTDVFYPAMDVKETKDKFIVTAELPGMKKEDIHIKFQDGALILEAERKEEKEEKDQNYHRRERHYGKFYRSFLLPTKIQADKINAKYKDGVLTIELPKAEEAKPKEIEVKVS